MLTAETVSLLSSPLMRLGKIWQRAWKTTLERAMEIQITGVSPLRTERKLCTYHLPANRTEVITIFSLLSEQRQTDEAPGLTIRETDENGQTGELSNSSEICNWI